MRDIVLEINNLSKSFAKNKVLDGIHLEVEEGTVCGLLGENGALMCTTAGSAFSAA